MKKKKKEKRRAFEVAQKSQGPHQRLNTSCRDYHGHVEIWHGPEGFQQYEWSLVSSAYRTIAFPGEIQLVRFSKNI